MGNGVFFFLLILNPVLKLGKEFLLSVIFLTVAWITVSEAIFCRLLILSIPIFSVFSEASGSRVTCCAHILVFLETFHRLSLSLSDFVLI